MRQKTAEHQDTIKIVGDPFAPEKAWLPVCGQAPAAAMEPVKPSILKKANGIGGQIISFISSVWGQALNMLIVAFLAAFIAYPLSGIDSATFMFRLGSDSGVFAQLLASSGFLMGFSRFPQIAKQSVKAIMLFGASFVAITSVLTGYCGTLPMVAAAVLGYLALEYFGSLVRNALPATVVPEKISSAFGLINLVPSAYSMYMTILCAGCHHANTAAGAAPAASVNTCPPEHCLVSAMIVGIGTFFIQSIVVARATKSTDVKACSSLALMFQSPIMFVLGYLGLGGLLLGASQPFIGNALVDFFNNVCCSAAKIDPAVLKQFWFVRPLYFAVAIGIISAASIAGGAAGAYLNGTKFPGGAKKRLTPAMVAEQA